MNDCNNSQNSLNLHHPALNNNDFSEYEIVKNDKGEENILGRGTFGDIKLIKHIKTNTLYSLKTVYFECFLQKTQKFFKGFQRVIEVRKGNLLFKE